MVPASAERPLRAGRNAPLTRVTSGGTSFAAGAGRTRSSSAEVNVRPVLYLDLDDTLIAWTDRRPRLAEGAREFLLWALDRYEVRWLTRWCPDGRMEEERLTSLQHLLGIPRERLAGLIGMDWSASGCKLDGLAWLEHLVLRRPFLWIEDEYGVGERERRFLEAHGLSDRYRHVNVTRDPGALRRLHAELAARENGP